MTMPTPEKTWQFQPNLASGGSGAYLTDFRQHMISLVRSLVDMPMNPWVVMGSSDGGASGSPSAGMDSVNRWKPGGVWDYTRLVWAAAGSAHGWIVLRQAGIFSTCELCIDLSNTNPYNITVVWGIDGFTGGSTTARPTATTSTTLINNGAWWAYQSNTASAGYFHAMQSTDGECTRIVGFWNDTPYVFWLLDKPKNPVTGWTNPAVMMCSSSTTSSTLTITWLNDTARLTGRIGSTFASLFMTGEGFTSTLIYENAAFLRPNQISGEVTMFPIGLVSETTAVKGRHGELFDIWWGPGGIPAGSPDGTWPDDSTKKYWSPDNITLPWNGLVTTGVAPLTRY